ncbi:MAG: hypothetical protein ABGW87_11255 [Sphingomonadaceae bacterium]
MTTMIKTALAVAAALGLASTPAVYAKPKMTGEEQLAKMLEGRVAGKPQSCIFTPGPGSDNMTIIDRTALVFRSGSTLWVNRTADPKSINDNDIIVFERFSGSQLCRTDMVHTVDRMSPHMLTGVVFLSDFVPYRKAG